MEESALAISYCNKCDRRSDCLEIALRFRMNEGIYGGMRPVDRDRYLVTRALKASKDYVERRNTLHEQQRLERESQVSPSYTAFVQNRNPLVLSWVVGGSPSSQAKQQGFVLNLLAWGSPLVTNQNSLSEPYQDEP